jgi:hypothetical protein
MLSSLDHSPPHAEVWASRFDCWMQLLVGNLQTRPLWVGKGRWSLWARPLEVVREMLRANEAEHVVLIVPQLANMASCNLFAQHRFSRRLLGIIDVARV